MLPPLPKQGLGLPPPHAPFCLRMSLSPRLSAMPCVLDLLWQEGGSKGGKLRSQAGNRSFFAAAPHGTPVNGGRPCRTVHPRPRLPT